MADLVTAADLADLLDISEIGHEDELEQVCSAATTVVLRALRTDVDHSTHATDREAAATVAVQIWQARQAPGGQMIGSDLMSYASPHLLGPGLMARVRGLTAPCALYGGLVVG
jgi:hypothetical protein